MNYKITPEERDFFEKLINDRKENARVIQKRSMRGIERDVVDKYPDSAHFIYELLQNADDAKATRISIRLENDGLIFKHNGTVHFNITDPENEEKDDKIGHINSITSVGASTKDQDDNAIGKFGVGFKAVFQYTNTPHIYDIKFKFLIKDLFVPELLDNDHEWRDEEETLFWFPFDRDDKTATEAYNEILQKLEELDNPILFLRSLQEIKWESKNNRGVYKKKIQQKEIINNIECQLVNINNNKQKSLLWMFTKEVEIKNIILPISVGLYLDNETNKLTTNGGGKVYCFFPIKDTIEGLYYILHAPFELVSSRQNIKDYGSINSNIINRLAELSAESLVCLRDISEKKKINYLDNSIHKFFPRKDKYSWDKGNHTIFHEAIVSVFKKERLFLTENKLYVNAENSYLTSPINLKELFDAQRLNRLLGTKGKDFIESEYSAKDADILDLLKDMGVNTLSTDDFADAITKSFMKAQPIKWLHKFYQFISEDAKNLWNIDTRYKNRQYKLRQKPIVLLESGEYASPDSEMGDINVFYKSDAANYTANIVKSSLLKVKITADFFAALGVKKPDVYDYITTYILPQYVGGNARIDSDKIREHIQTLFEYSENCPTNKRTDYIKKLSTTLLLVAKNSVTGKSHLYSPSKIYDDNDYLKHFFSIIELGKEQRQVEEWKREYVRDYGENVECIKVTKGEYLFKWKYYDRYEDVYIEEEEEEIYVSDNECLFLDTEFYGDILNNPEIKDFVCELGIMQHPEISNSYDWRRDLSSIKPVNMTLREGQDYDISDLKLYIKQDITFKDSLILWEILCNIHSIYYKAEYRFYPPYGRRDTDTIKVISSKFINLLQNEKWIYTIDKQLVRPIDILIDELDELYIRKQELIEVLCFKTEPKSSNLPPEIQEELDFARKLKSKYTSEDFAELDEIKQKREAKERRKQEKLLQNDNHTSNDHDTPKSTEELFSNDVTVPTSKPKQKEDAINKNLEALTERQKEEFDEHCRINDLRSEVAELPKYSFKWFVSLLELEYKSSGEESYGNRSITINFGSVEKELNSERIYILKNPSRYIPTSLEEMGGLTVKFVFSNRDEVSIGFEVANVKDFSLRLKAKLGESEQLAQIDFSQCNKAIVEIGNPVQLIDKLRKAFISLNFAEDFNLRDNLQNNVSFVFGPPGTGKTTHLSRKIINFFNSNEKCKVLVLTPTNKACDVIAKKIIEVGEGEIPSWLSRFAATGDESLEMIVQGRDSDVYNEDKCCIISTIARYPYDKFSNPIEDILLKNVDWDYIIIDEASMIPLSYISYVIYTQEKKNIAIAGDPFQIEPIVREELWKGGNIYSMIDLQRFDEPKTIPIQFDIKNLDTQYRSVPSIGSLFSHYSYNGKLKHARNEDDKKELEIDGVNVESVNYLPFKVERYDSIFGVKKLSSSNIHIYSVLFVFEFVKYVESQINEKYSEDLYRIGIICPYAAQAQLIERLFEQYTVTNNVEIMVGTIHGFQGDECDIVFAVFNPPMGLKREPEKTFINNKNIVNVAISRARDYLFIVMPDNSMENFNRLYQLNELGKITKSLGINSSTQHCFDIENKIFDLDEHIERKTFVTTHQMANVYSTPDKVYEVRVDESAIDIQINIDL